jgi:hypothetical protein
VERRVFASSSVPSADLDLWTDQTSLRSWLLAVPANAKVDERRLSKRREDFGQVSLPIPQSVQRVGNIVRRLPDVFVLILLILTKDASVHFCKVVWNFRRDKDHDIINTKSTVLKTLDHQVCVVEVPLRPIL